jgi:two-component system, cell cycle sensor histidine kinase and response regulator CckA
MKSAARIKRQSRNEIIYWSQPDEASETLRAIRMGEVDAVLVQGGNGDSLFTLNGADDPYRMIIEEMNQGAVTLSAEGSILYCNRRFAELLKKPLDKIVGFAFESLVTPPERGQFAKLLARGRIESSAGEITLQASDASPVPLQLALGPLPAKSAAKICLVATDIAEIRRMEQKLREQADIVERATDAVVVCDFVTDCITIWNKGAEHLYGWSAEEAIGRSMGELMFRERDNRDAFLKQLVSTGEFHGEIKHRAKDGRELTVDARVTVVRNDDGTPRSVLGINTDVTEQKKLEVQLIRAQRLENIGTLASGVAHDLNNILTPILMCAQTLRDDLNVEDRESAVSLIEASGQRGANVVKQMLTFARGVEGERVSIQPSHLVHEMVDIAQRTFPKSIEITARCSEDLWSVKGDPTQLHQVLLNISLNARDAMSAGGKLVVAANNLEVDEHYAAMTPEATTGRYVLLQISDTGKGMLRETIDEIFDPFFTTKELGKGTGLGLSIALGIVKSHGGFISVHSEIGKGTVFKIFLPAEVYSQNPVSLEKRVAPAEGHGELVLVVDDEENILRVIKSVLQKHKYNVLCAGDGVEAVALFAQQMDAIAVVLTDIVMPHMDGIALVRALTKMKADTPIIAFTGDAHQARLDELRAMNVNNFLIKPFNAEDLLAAVHALIDRVTKAEAETETT